MRLSFPLLLVALTVGSCSSDEPAHLPAKLDDAGTPIAYYTGGYRGSSGSPSSIGGASASGGSAGVPVGSVRDASSDSRDANDAAAADAEAGLPPCPRTALDGSSEYITVKSVADATGAVRIETDGGDGGTKVVNAARCPEPAPLGARPIKLVAEPGPGFYFGGWSGGCSGFELSCTPAPGVPVSATFSPANIAFLTYDTYSRVDLESAGTGATAAERVLSGADALCMKAARSGHPPLPGHYKAWLASLNHHAPDRLAAARPEGAPRGWIRPDGKPFLDADFEWVFYVGVVTENGTVPDYNGTWTGLEVGTTGGFAPGDSCGDWTSSNPSALASGGIPSAGGTEWMIGHGFYCDSSLHLVCLGVDYAVSIPRAPVPAGARVAFLGSLFDPSTGVAGADKVCGDDASRAGLPGTFRAVIADPGQIPASRFQFSGTAPFVRPDGVVLVDSDSDFFSERLHAAPNVNAGGDQQGGWLAYLGAVSPFSAVDIDSSCAGWTSSESVYWAAYASPEFTTPFDGSIRNPCGISTSVFCLQD